MNIEKEPQFNKEAEIEKETEKMEGSHSGLVIRKLMK